MAGEIGKQPRGSKLTYQDYLSLPDDDRRHELLDGDLAVTPSPLIRHQRAFARVFKIMSNWVELDLREIWPG